LSGVVHPCLFFKALEVRDFLVYGWNPFTLQAKGQKSEKLWWKNLESRERNDGFSSTVWITRVSHKIWIKQKKTGFDYKVYEWKSSARLGFP